MAKAKASVRSRSAFYAGFLSVKIQEYQPDTPISNSLQPRHFSIHGGFISLAPIPHSVKDRQAIPLLIFVILTSHYTPGDLKDAQTKIDYLENLKKVAAGCADADTFKAEVQKEYPAYSGQNYLDMTAGFFFA